jgi:type I restriction enzyme S subunit
VSNWSDAHLADVADVFNGKTPSKAEQRNEGHPVLKIRDVNDYGDFRGRFGSFVDEEFATKYEPKCIRDGDILILNAAHNAEYVGSKTYSAQPQTLGALATGEWLVVRPRGNRLYPRFAKFWIESSQTRSAIRELVKGIHLYPKDVSRLRIKLPTLSEQRRIAEVLDQAEALRAKRRAALAQLDTLTQAIFLDMFGEERDILEKWPTRSLGGLLEFLTSGSRGWAKHYSEQGDLFLRIQNVKHDELSLDDIAYVTPPDTAEAKRTRVEPYDVLLSITADLGRNAVVPHGLGPAYINQHLAILRTGSLAPKFLSAYLNSPSGQRQIARKNRHGVKAGLNFDDIRSFSIPTPPLNLQREFALRASKIEHLKVLQRRSQMELNAVFGSLQSRAFEGNL